MLDELEFLREDARLNAAERDAAVGDLIDLVVAVDGILQAQARADATYFESIAGKRYADAQRIAIGAGILKAYRWQYIVSGVMEPRFQKVLFGVLDDKQAARVMDALQPLLYAMPARFARGASPVALRHIRGAQQETESMVPELMLLGFAAWTLLLLLTTVGGYRLSRVFRGRAGMGDFPADRVEGQGWYVRAMRAHANCVENLPVFAVLVYALRASASSDPAVDSLCAVILAARIPQSLVHVCFAQTDRVVSVRFALFFIQFLSFSALTALIVFHR